MTMEIVSLKIMKHLSQETVASRAGIVKLLMKLVNNGRLRAPMELMPFRKKAQEILNWVQGGDVGE
jgi:hypothetical protein